MEPRAAKKKTDTSQFSTEHLTQDIGSRSARGGLVALVSQGIRFFLHIGSTMILARLLSPADFGMVAMVAAFTGFVVLFRDLGLTAATVQRTELTAIQISTVFWINVTVSVVLMLIGFALAPVVAWLYGEPDLRLVTVAISATFILGGLTSQHIALLQRQMRFVSLAYIDIAAMLMGVIVGISLAWYGAGYWALIAMSAATAATAMVTSWMASGWIPGPPKRDPGVSQMLRFGGYLMGFNVLNHVRKNADNVLLGVFWGSTPLGLYSKAYALVLLPVNQLIRPISSVMITSLSRLQDSPSKYADHFCGAVKATLYLALPILLFLVVMADEVILIVLGHNWIEAALIFQILSIFAITQVIAATTGWVLISSGQTDRMFRWQVFQASFMVLAFVIGIKWGAKGVAAAATIASSLTLIPYLVFAFRKSHISVWRFAHTVRRPVFVGLTFSASLLTLKTIVSDLGLMLATAIPITGASIVVAALVYVSKPIRNDIIQASRLLVERKGS